MAIDRALRLDFSQQTGISLVESGVSFFGGDGFPGRTAGKRSMYGARKLTRGFSELWRCRHASAGMEFAIVLPIMLTMYAGIVELNNFNNTYLRVCETAFELEDLVGRQEKLCDSTTCTTAGAIPIGLICALAQPIFQSGTNADLTSLTLKIDDATVSNAQIGSTNGTIAWEATSTATASSITCAKNTAATGTNATLTTDITSSPGATTVSHVIVTATYSYTSIFSSSFLAFLKLPALGKNTSGIKPSLTYPSYGVPRYIVGVIPYTTS